MSLEVALWVSLGPSPEEGHRLLAHTHRASRSRRPCVDPTAGTPSRCLVQFCPPCPNLCVPLERRWVPAALRHTLRQPPAQPRQRWLSELGAEAPLGLSTAAETLTRSHWERAAHRSARGEGGSLALTGTVPVTSPDPAAGAVKGPV